MTTSALQNQTCAGFREGAALGCSAGEFTVTPILSAEPGTPPFCVLGQSFEFLVNLRLSGTNALRYDIGFFAGQEGNNPSLATAGNICSVATFPLTPSPWLNSNSNSCGDYLAGGDSTTTINKIKVKCQGDSTGALQVPYTLVYSQNAGSSCTGPGDVKSGSASKCNSGIASVSGTVAIGAGGYVDVTKQTLPIGNTTQAFSYTATGPAGSKVSALVGTTYTPTILSSATNTVTVTITGGQTVRFFINALSTNQTLTINEAATTNWEATATISCSAITGAPALTTDNVNRTISAAISAVNSAAACTITNTKRSRITLVKNIGGRVDSTDQFTVSASGGGTLIGPTTATTTGTVSTASTIFYSTPAMDLTLSDVKAAGPTSLTAYDTRLTCTNAFTGPGATANASLPSNLNASSATITPAPGDDITCTYTNTPKPRISLQKNIITLGNGRVTSSDQFILAITGATSVTTTGTGSSVTSSAASLIATADAPITLSETMVSGNLNNYTTTYACINSGTGGTVIASGTGSSFSFTPANNDIIACTFTNTRKSATLRLVKTWANAISGNTATVTTTGFIQNASSGLSTSTGNNSTTGTSVTVFAGESGSISEAFGVGDGANYTGSLVCSGNNTLLSGSTLTISSADTAIVCTQTNTRKSVNIVLKKTWVNAALNDSVDVTGTGLMSLNSIANTANDIDIGPIQIAYAGDVIALSEVFNSGNAGNYSSALSCTGTTGLSGTNLTLDSGDTSVICTYTNTNASNIPAEDATITGTVFKDSGTGAGIANNAIQEAAEIGIASANVKLTDCAATTYSTAVTNGTGAYSLSTAGVPAGTVCVEQTNLSGYTSTGNNVAGSRTPVGYTLVTTDKISFNLAASTSYTSLNFGDVPVNQLLTDGIKTGLAGTTVFYTHSFIAGTGGSVSFSLPGATASPVILGWNEVLYTDTNCNGSLDGVDPQTPSTPLAVVEGAKICLIVKEFISAAAPVGASNLAVVKADFVYTNALPVLTASYTRQDLTTVSDATLGLSKKVRNVTLDGAGSPNWQVSNIAKTGEILEYQISYTNNGTTPINALIVKDATPAYTTFVSALANALPNNLTGCTKTTPTSNVPISCSALDTQGGAGGVAWTFTGALAPSASGAVTFKVKLN